jgi:hypothetical protein
VDKPENTELYTALGFELEKNFELENSFEVERAEDISLNEIKKRLESVIRNLLDKDLERLLSILYLIDVSQDKTDEIFSIDSKDDIAPLLAEAVIQRQLEKLETRMKYRTDNEKPNGIVSELE